MGAEGEAAAQMAAPMGLSWAQPWLLCELSIPLNPTCLARYLAGGGGAPRLEGDPSSLPLAHESTANSELGHADGNREAISLLFLGWLAGEGWGIPDLG